MKNKLIKTGVLAALAACITLTSGCQKDDMRIFKHDPSEPTSSLSGKPSPDPTNPGISNFVGRMQVYLKDLGNAGFGAIDLTFAGIALHYTDERVGKGGWIYLNRDPHLFNILMYQEGAGLLLGSSKSLPLGVIDDVRVLFGDPNYVVWGDMRGKYKADLLFSKSGHMVDVNLHLPVDLHRGMIVTLGFNANESITHQADGVYFCKPDIFLEHIRYAVTSPVEENPDPITK